jgi:hypothetical protein
VDGANPVVALQNIVQGLRKLKPERAESVVDIFSKGLKESDSIQQAQPAAQELLQQLRPNGL